METKCNFAVIKKLLFNFNFMDTFLDFSILDQNVVKGKKCNDNEPNAMVFEVQRF